MGWGFALAAGASLLGASKSASAANSQSAAAMAELEFMREQAELMNEYRDQLFGMGQDAMDRENEIFDYVMGFNDTNQALVRDFMNYSRAWADDDREFKRLEQDYEKYRVGEADRLAAEERARQLEKLIDDERTTKAERERALQELDYTRSIAAGERQYDVKQYESDQMLAQLEYQYRMQQYEEQRGIANSERQREIDQQERILREAGILRDTIDRTMRGMGDLAPLVRYGEDDVNAYTDEFFGAYQSDADRAVDRIASVNEAGLIQRGVDSSTTADESRKRLLQEQVIPLYETARANARRDAMGYVTSLQDNEVNAFNSEVQARAAQIDEQIRGNTAIIDIINNLKTPGSARVSDYLQLGTGTINPRSLTSAGTYGAPIQIGSGVMNREISAPGMDSTRSLDTSRAGVQRSTYDGTFSPQIPDYTKAGSFYSNVMGTPYSSQSFSTLAQGAGNAGAASSEHLMNFATNIGQWLDK